MTEVWTWWVGSDKERYTTECATREEAVKIARDEYEGGWITEARPPQELTLASYFDAELFLERAEDCAQDDCGDPEGDALIFDVTTAQVEHLNTIVQNAITKWQKWHELTFRGWQFAAMRNTEFIPDADDAVDLEDYA